MALTLPSFWSQRAITWLVWIAAVGPIISSEALATDLTLVAVAALSIITIAAAEDDSSLHSILDLPILFDNGSKENVYNQHDDLLRVTSHHRMLQETDQPCTICADISNLRNDSVPSINSAYDIISFRGNNNDTVDRTCEEWESYLTTEGNEVTADYCLELRNWLIQQCCAGLPPLYECETFVEELLLDSEAPSYHKYRVPVARGNALNVSVHLQVTHYEILDHGWKGGSLAVSGALSLHWTDERLKWNNTLLALNNKCATTSVCLFADDIFTPSLQVRTEVRDLSSKVTVLSDGRVFWSRRIHDKAECTTTYRGAGKNCSFALLDKNNGDRINYNTLMNNGDESTGMVIHHSLNLTEYKFNKNQSTVLIRSGTFEDVGDNDEGEDVFTGMITHEVKFQLDFGPLEKECNICGYGEGVLEPNATLHDYPLSWLEVFPNTKGWSCSEIDNLLLQNVSTSEDVCLNGRASFEEACCKDNSSSFECESQIHTSLLENNIGDNTITPPDPSQLENDPSFSSEDAVDVQLNVDIQHIIGIDVKTNSLQIQLSLELEWFDPRLSWEPFVGGCHRASFRASVWRELTEIWVPKIKLINMLQGVQDLPEADASVQYNGRVKWRRTGILIASCDLTGIENFPFDTTGCYMDFGATRDPLSHRVNFVKGTVEFSERIRDKTWNFQEYKTRIDKFEEMGVVYTENMSGFQNTVLRIQLYFDRAKNYYVHMFLLLYIVFTYLSFGMFFIDYGLGERLGYGTSVLFVMVAQDITLAEATPVTQEFLWIYRLSLGSKLFVIFGVIESIVVLWLYKRKDFGDEHHPVTLTRVDSKDPEFEDAVMEMEETRTFIDEEAQQNYLHDEHSGERNHIKGQKETSASFTPDKVDLSRSQSWRAIGLFPGRAFVSAFEVHEEDSERRKLIKRLRAADLTCFFLFTIAYTLMLICLYAII